MTANANASFPIRCIEGDSGLAQAVLRAKTFSSFLDAGERFPISLIGSSIGSSPAEPPRAMHPR